MYQISTFTGKHNGMYIVNWYTWVICRINIHGTSRCAYFQIIPIWFFNL